MITPYQEVCLLLKSAQEQITAQNKELSELRAWKERVCLAAGWLNWRIEGK